jgi:hypothetical protein
MNLDEQEFGPGELGLLKPQAGNRAIARQASVLLSSELIRLLMKRQTNV